MIDDNVEVTRVSSRGIWLKAHQQKFFLSYYDFPWFKNKSVQALLHVEEPLPGQFYWPELNLNLAMETLRAPHRHPPASARAP